MDEKIKTLFDEIANFNNQIRELRVKREKVFDEAQQYFTDEYVLDYNYTEYQREKKRQEKAATPAGQ